MPIAQTFGVQALNDTVPFIIEIESQFVMVNAVCLKEGHMSDTIKIIVNKNQAFFFLLWQLQCFYGDVMSEGKHVRLLWKMVENDCMASNICTNEYLNIGHILSHISMKMTDTQSNLLKIEEQLNNCIDMKVKVGQWNENTARMTQSFALKEYKICFILEVKDKDKSWASNIEGNVVIRYNFYSENVMK